MEYLLKYSFHHLVSLWSVPCSLTQMFSVSCRIKILNSRLHWSLCLFPSTGPSALAAGYGKEQCLWPATFTLLWDLGSLCWAPWVAFSSVLDLSKCCWASSSPMTLSQHFCSCWSMVSIYVHGPVLCQVGWCWLSRGILSPMTADSLVVL